MKDKTLDSIVRIVVEGRPAHEFPFKRLYVCWHKERTGD